MLDVGMISFCLFIATFFAYKELGIATAFKALRLFLITCISAFYGARILHAIIENPGLLQQPENLLLRFDGMTFNGSLLFGFITFYLGISLFEKSHRASLWDIAGLSAAFSYGLLRIGCFLKGCCWGKISAVPWAAHYHDSKYMPWHGIPVHPVQLYDATVGFSIFLGLIILRRKNILRGHHFTLFLCLYAVGRFFTEFFRGDDFRGSDLALNLSTSQFVSLFLLLLVFLRYQRKLALFSLFIVATGCLPQIPKSPKSSNFESVTKTDAFEIYELKRKDKPERIIIFVAADDSIQKPLAPKIQQLYKSDSVRLEDMVFWQYFKDIKKTYSTILRLPYQSVNYQNVVAALDYAENLRQPYDIIFLTHGLPNHLSIGSNYFLSFRELSQLRLPHLDLVMMQSCFGRSLTQDWLQAGAKSVLSYDGFNRNFFFYGPFLRAYASEPTLELAYQKAIQELPKELKKPQYKMLIRSFDKKYDTNNLNAPFLDKRSD